MLDFELLLRQQFLPDELPTLNYDWLISAYNDSERVQTVFDRVSAARKSWFVHSEYRYGPGELPTDAELYYSSPGDSEVDFWFSLFESFAPTGLGALSIAIDITGAMRPHLMILPRVLQILGVQSVDLLYSDPLAYLAGSSTVFTKGPVTHVAPIGGLEGSHASTGPEHDLLVIGAGYDAELVRRAAEHKRSATQRVIVGLPGLQAHMYQEARLRLSGVSESISALSDRTFLYSPADNPFVTAGLLGQCIAQVAGGREINVYISPLGPKPQVLGFAWYMAATPNSDNVTALFPYADSYARETSRGLARTHLYRLELDWVTPPHP